MCQEIAAANARDRFDVFILSDTQDAERASGGTSRLCQTPGRDGVQVYVRWRTLNLGKKAGNIRDWIERFGAAYPYFIILDADSIMSAESLLRLVAGMEDNHTRWPNPDRAAPRRRQNRFRAPAAICRRLLWPNRFGGACRLARTWGQLLGP